MNRKCLLIIAIGILLIAVFSIVGLEYFRPTSKDDAVYEGPPVYIASIFADDDQLWLLRAKRLGIPHEYELYKLGDNGRQEYVCPYEGTAPFWNQCSGKAYFLALSGQSIGEFDPAAKETQYYSLKRQYIHICGADGDAVFLQQELYGKVYMYSLYGSEERELETSGWVLEACRGYLIMWDPFTFCLTCYECASDQTIWSIDVSEEFQSAPRVCELNGDLYLGNRNGGYIYSIPAFEKNCELVDTGIHANVIGMISAGGRIFVAAGSSSEFKLGTFKAEDSQLETLALNNSAKYYLDGSFMMTVYSGKLYYTVTTEDELYSVELQF